MQKIEKDTFTFLQELKTNNNRDWFNENKDRYMAAQQNVLEFVTELLQEMSEFDAELVKIDPKKSLFRIYRDTRFSADKTPYKTNFGASINGIGKKDGGAGYYLHISPGECFLAGGVYMADAARMKNIRKEISTNAPDFLNIVNSTDFSNFDLNSEKMVRIPQGFEKDDTMAEYLKMKHYAASLPIKDEFLMKPDSVQKCAAEFRKMAPFVQFLNAV